jgi:hypothetical protein
MRIAALCACLCLAPAVLAAGPMTRGRVRIEGNTIVSDWGTHLRGGCWSTGSIFGRQELAQMKLAGLNALHLYAERFEEGKVPGWAAVPYIDSIVEWCRQDSVYLVMCVAGPKTVPYFADYTRKFWKFYAPRYADQTHVVYEILNEGCMATSHCVDTVMDLYRECYNIIRESAPYTHVLFLSHSNLKGGIDPLFEDVDRLGPDIDWTNASIAFHGYGTTAAFQEQASNTLGKAGYAMTNTEFPFSGGGELAKAYERAGISYFWFEACWGGTRTLGNIGSYLKKTGVTWQPDFGSWPQPHVEHPDIVATANPRVTLPGKRGSTTARLSFGQLPRGNVRAVYDLRGRLVWTNAQRADGLRRVPGARLLVVRYSE